MKTRDTTDFDLLYKQGSFKILKRKIFNILSKTNFKDNPSLTAICYHYLGNIMEVEKRIGDACRYWGHALSIYENYCNSTNILPNAERIKDLLHQWQEHQEVFVSYAHTDQNRIKGVLDALKKAKINLRIDNDFIAGQSVYKQICKAIRECPIFLIFYSSNYLLRSWTAFELKYIRQKLYQDKEHYNEFTNGIIFFCLDTNIPKDEFSTLLCIKYNSKKDIDTLIRSIKERM